jgi:CRP/FNR family transcriptional regulator, cyclic AMP receptor protein
MRGSGWTTAGERRSTGTTPRRTLASATDRGGIGCAPGGSAGATDPKEGTVANPKLEAILAYVPLFHDLSKREIKKIASLCDVGDYMAGAAVVKQGDAGDAFYVVLKGQAKVTSNGRFITRLVPGDHFGEIAVLDGGERTATVTSETPMTLVILRRKELLKALRSDADLSFHMMTELAKMIRRATKSNTQ